MHEVSIVQQIISTLENTLSAEEQNKIEKIFIHVGELSNVQPILLVNAFEALQEAENKFKNVTMYVTQIPITLWCEKCKKESSVKKYVFRCNWCDTPSNKILTGEELLIHKITYKIDKN